MYKAISLWMVCACLIQALAADASVTKLWQRNSEPLGPAAWKAKWIWVRSEGRPGRGRSEANTSSPDANTTVLARKAFELPRVPGKATLFITADSHYRLFVNGEYANRGPARCDSKRQSYDVLDVAPLLRVGRNVIAVEVHHYGYPTSFHDAGRPGLLAQLEIESAETIATGSSWRARRAPQWDTSTPRIDGRQGFVEVIDFRRAIDGWKLPGFDDANWEAAAPVLPERSPWIPQQPYFESQTITRPWLSLLPRDLPYLRETAVRAARVIQTDEVLELGRTAGAVSNDIAAGVAQDIHVALETCRITDLDEYAAGSAPLVVTNAPRDDSVAIRGIRSSYVAFDLGRLMYGHPVVDVDGPAGTVIDVSYATRLTGGKVIPTYMGLRLADRVVLSGKSVRWEGRERKALRYIAVTVRNSTAPVRFRFIGAIQTEYPFMETGAFEMDDEPNVNLLWRAGLATVRGVTTDAYTDNYREQKQYAGTSFYAARANAAGFGDTRLQRRYLMQVAAQQLRDGLLPPSSSVPGDREPEIILEYNLFWVMGLRDYFLFSGDTHTVTGLLPVAEKILARFSDLENSKGLIENPPYPFWIDHANIDHRGESFALNAIYLNALENYAQVLGWLKRSGQDDVEARAVKVRSALNSGFWSEKRGLFADGRISGELSPRFSEQTNSLALAFGLVAPEQAKSIAASILSSGESDMVRSTPLFMYWVAEGLFRAGFSKESLELLKTRFRHMLDAGLGTLWEEWSLTGTKRSGEWQPTTRSTAQAEASFPPWTLMRWVLGVEPVAPGWSEVLIHVPQAPVRGAGGTVPLPQGPLTLHWTGRALKITAPHGAGVALALNDVKQVVLDGRTLSARDIAGGRVLLSGGSHDVSFR